jgi:enamine deaminase RidA (YjgF/YER057c/UK114 family)
LLLDMLSPRGRLLAVLFALVAPAIVCEHFEASDVLAVAAATETKRLCPAVESEGPQHLLRGAATFAARPGIHVIVPPSRHPPSLRRPERHQAFSLRVASRLLPVATSSGPTAEPGAMATSTSKARRAFKVGGFVFAAGQLASDFKSGVPVQARRHPSFPYYSSDIKLQTRFVLDNLKRRREPRSTGGVEAQVFLTDLNNFNGFDEVWKENFKVRRRARPSAPPGSWSRTRWSRST